MPRKSKPLPPSFPVTNGRPIVERAYTYDGAANNPGVVELPCVIITGRTIDRMDDGLRALAGHLPVFIRPFGARLDKDASARWKAMVIAWLEVKVFYEHDLYQYEIIRAACPQCDVRLIESPAPKA